MQNIPQEKLNKINVLIESAEALFLLGVKTLLLNTGNYEIKESKSEHETVRALKESPFNAVFIEEQSSHEKTIEKILALKKDYKGINILLFAESKEIKFADQIIASGASAYILKDCELESATKAFETMRNGGTFISPLTSLKIVKSTPSNAGDPLEKLSNREREVFFMLVEGKPNRVIAKQLFLSPRTVETHRARLIKKLGLNSTAELVYYAVKNSLLAI